MKNEGNVAGALEHCFISPNEADSNMEQANVVDVIAQASRDLHRIAHAITPQNAAPVNIGGGVVGSLTEAVISLAENVGRVADAISEVADAIRSREG